ncbi:MAG: hypothetical protein IJF54_06820 [Clostridia bacterium]|nr:hypothetical protein [Clostridia bacterium]
MADKLDLLKTLNCFISLAQMTRDAAMKHIYFIELATNEIQASLTDDAANKDEFFAVYNACGALAYYKFALSCASCDDEQQFSAGDVTVRRAHGAKVQYAKQLLDEALIAISPILKDKSFVFGII